MTIVYYIVSRLLIDNNLPDRSNCIYSCNRNRRSSNSNSSGNTGSSSNSGSITASNRSNSSCSIDSSKSNSCQSTSKALTELNIVVVVDVFVN